MVLPIGGDEYDIYDHFVFLLIFVILLYMSASDVLFAWDELGQG